MIINKRTIIIESYEKCIMCLNMNVEYDITALFVEKYCSINPNAC
jgi:hypothetical protein